MIGVIINPRSGYVAAHGIDHLQALIAGSVSDARIHVLQAHDDIGARCRELCTAGAACIAAVGGDGTIGAVAAHLIHTPISLGVIPGGTLNHFARDVGVGRDVPEAIQILARGKSTSVDVATVNDRVFLNNSSLGLYPELVYMREADEQQLGKFRAMVRAILLVFRRAQWLDIDLGMNGKKQEVRTRLLFVGNNQYELGLLHLGQRQSLHAGVLCCFVLDAPNRWRLTQTAFTSLLADRYQRRFFRSHLTRELTVSPRDECEVQVSADGEIYEMKMPLVYKIQPGALRVIVP